MKSSLKLVIFFKLFEGEVVFELVFKLFELNRPLIFRIEIFLVFELVVVFNLFDRPSTCWIGIFLVFKLMIVFLNSLKMWLSFNSFSNSSKAGSSLNSFLNSSNLALYFPDQDFFSLRTRSRFQTVRPAFDSEGVVGFEYIHSSFPDRKRSPEYPIFSEMKTSLNSSKAWLALNPSTLHFRNEVFSETCGHL